MRLTEVHCFKITWIYHEDYPMLSFDITLRVNKHFIMLFNTQTIPDFYVDREFIFIKVPYFLKIWHRRLGRTWLRYIASSTTVSVGWLICTSWRAHLIRHRQFALWPNIAVHQVLVLCFHFDILSHQRGFTNSMFANYAYFDCWHFLVHEVVTYS